MPLKHKYHIFRSFFYLFSLFIVCNIPVQAAPPEGYHFLSLTQAIQQSTREKKPMLLYFGRYGCTTCRKMHKEVFTDEALKKDLTDQFILAYVDTESGKRIRMPNGERTTEMQFAARNRILGTPTFIYFSADQKPRLKRAGFQTIQQMELYNDYISGKHFREMKFKDYLAGQ